jgi:hypothetical protein
MPHLPVHSDSDRRVATQPDPRPTQHRLAADAAVALWSAGYAVVLGEIGDHVTAEIPMPHGRHLVLHPMAETVWLAPEDFAAEGADPDAWHVLMRGADGEIVGWDDNDVYGCPSVLWALRLGLDPQMAVFLVQAVLSDDECTRRFASGRVS